MHSVVFTDDGVPTCIDFLASDPNHMMAAYSSGNVYVFDLSTGQQVVKFNTQPPGKPALSSFLLTYDDKMTIIIR